MYKIRQENIIIFPLAFNAFYYEACLDKRDINYSKEYSLKEKLIEDLIAEIDLITIDRIIAIDMKKISSYPPRAFDRFNDASDKNIFFYNINNDLVKKRMEEDLQVHTWYKETICCLNTIVESKVNELYDIFCFESYASEYKNIISDLIDCPQNGKAQTLESSGLYSNMYVNTKKLYLDKDKYYFILYSLSELISEKCGDYDAFVSSSKNGAILANLLGAILNKKVIHISGVGPKFSMTFGSVNDYIKKGKKYIYVFDFICTGTEMKITSALVNANKAIIKCGIGIAKYKEPINNNELSSKMYSLLSLNNAGINYKIAGEQNDIIILNK